MVDSEQKEPEENSEPVIGGEEPVPPASRNDFVIGATEDSQSKNITDANQDTDNQDTDKKE